MDRLAEQELAKRLKPNSGESRFEIDNQKFEFTMPAAKGWERFTIKIENGKIVTGTGPYAFWDGGTTDLRKFDLSYTGKESAEDFFVRKLTSLARYKGDSISAEDARSLFKDVLLILENSKKLRENPDMQTISLCYNADQKKMNQPTSRGFLPTVSQRNYEADGALGCLRAVKGLVFSLYNTDAFPGLARLFGDRSAEEVNQYMRKAVGRSQRGSLTGPVEIEGIKFRYSFLDGFADLTNAEKHTLEHLGTGTMLLLRHKDRPDATHISAVIRGKDEGGLLHYGGSRPVMEHTIGSRNIREQIQYKHINGCQRAVVSDDWIVVGVIAPPQNAILFSKGVPNLREGFTDIVVPEGTTVADFAKWPRRNNTDFRAIPEQHVINFLKDLNPDNIQYLSKLDADIAGPMRIPTKHLPAFLQRKSFPGTRSEKVCALQI